VMTVDQVAAHLQESTDTVRAKIKAGRLKAINVGTDRRPRYRITEDQLAEYEGKCVIIKLPPSTQQRYRHARY
jgi:excisionase family DNA binding protein